MEGTDWMEAPKGATPLLSLQGRGKSYYVVLEASWIRRDGSGVGVSLRGP